MTEKITGRILEQAQEQADRIQREAAEQALAVVARAKEEAQQLVAETEGREKTGIAQIEERHLSVAELSAKKEQLSAKIHVLDRAFAKAEEALFQMDAVQYCDIYRHVVLKAITTGNEGIAPASDESRLNQVFVDSLNRALEEAGKSASLSLLPSRSDFHGGCAVCEGEMEMNFSIQSMMRQVRERVQGRVAAILFPEEG